MFLKDTAQNFELLCKIIDNSPDIIFTIDLNGKILYVNESFTEILGYSKEEVIGRHIREIATEESIYNACMISVKSTGKCLDQETVFRRKDGTLVHVVKNVNALYNEKGDIEYLIVNARDLTHLDNINKQLQRLKTYLEKRYELIYSIFLNISDAVAILDKNGYYLEQNKAHENLIGYSIEELIGKTPSIHLKKEDLEKIFQEVKSKGSYLGEIRIKTKSGEYKDVELFAFALYDENGEISNIIGIKKDKSLEKQLIYLDKLTNLPNRIKLMEDLKNLTDYRILVINIDSFKEINDVYGVDIGDKLLNALGKRLKEIAEKHNFNVYKLSGDEFLILIDRFYPKTFLESLVNEILHQVQSKPFEVEGLSINLDITIGAAEGSKDETKALEKADMALKYAKQNKKNFVCYDETLKIQEVYQNNISWVRNLKKAIDEDGFLVYYQPILNNQTNKLGKYESLIRVKIDDMIYSPYYFLDIAKKSKLYTAITKKVFKEAVKYATDYEISINLSVLDILNEEISTEIIKTLREKDLKITFEILESEGIENYENVSGFIKNVKKFGAKVAIDDFGSGYSNFAYILKLDVDYIKIDASLIKNIHQDKNSQIIVENIVNLAKKLGIKTIAEFVHCKEVFEKVKELGIDYSQGYYISEPKDKITENFDTAS
ncbi:EAL domain-containing protein [Sulfurihydrogenibium subterraneum]|uniref:EAL domain-containing protein n=1 Tax=Sulfurihydrogenibium subterraneum TaxID=171121 RepID=UPI000686268A|nr:EAL domain-containing protein [Sulfurihydrogenibium subterraneum]